MGNRLSIQFKNLFKSIPIIIILISILLCNCTEQSTEPNDDEGSFSFKVRVVDDSNNPLENMKVGSWYHPSNNILPSEIGIYKIDEPNVSTTINFSIKENCIANMGIYDLNNRLVKTVIHDNLLYEGFHQLILDANDLIGSVYKYVLTTRDTSNTIFFKDSLYAVLITVDEFNNEMGFTNASGEFESNNQLYFPSLYALPELIHTTEVEPSPIQTFSITDTITIMITDPINNITGNYIKTIKNGRNEFTLTFPGSIALQKSIDISDKRTIENSNGIIINKLSNTAFDWELHQNYPNPFN